ncbi:ParB/RepB/Spo0J family partition protein [Fimbriiglobus ruber]|uniref:Chromosome (Plasmid) partitioning protein ParB / Stage 0 sporulation protein J n=1 Tax=Fimbriiglobus ruber TaxID=1908690 RepID=A0A225DRZ6_9BACT|nr:ParB N-terminal domain-containing protein [Fimbriiglobus ruber]OWK42374.1 Chromosome (plasmid) partitioning protein ParB / Stage 0 sporulation protein J [Fimbriiglobus ruber]
MSTNPPTPDPRPQGNTVRPPTLVHVHLSELLQPLKDIRDRDTPEYREFLDRLAADLKARGMQVPILAYREGDKLRIIDGLTRFLAALLALLETVPVYVYAEKPNEAELILGQLLANSMRRDMTVLELAAVYLDLKKINNWNDSTLARHVHANASQVHKILAISTRLCEQCKAMVAAGDLAPRAAYAISRLADAAAQVCVAEKFKKDVLCAQGVEAEVTRLLAGSKKTKAEKPLGLEHEGIALSAKKPTLEALRAFAEKFNSAVKKMKTAEDVADLPYLFKNA